MTRIVCIGDSITAGQYIDGHLAWPNLLQGFEVIPRGISNETTRQALERFPRDVQERDPDIVIIQFGLNDCNRWETDRWLPRVSPAAFEANLTEMVTRTRKFDAEPILCTLSPTLKEDEFQADAAHYDDLIRDVADRTWTRLFDVRGWLMGTGGQYLLDDGVHLNELGHKVYACGVQHLLAKVTVPA